jgi:hypothetical protein
MPHGGTPGPAACQASYDSITLSATEKLIIKKKILSTFYTVNKLHKMLNISCKKQKILKN